MITCGGVTDRMWATKGEFFEPTSFLSTMCAWTANGIQTGAPNKAQVYRSPCWFYRNSHDHKKYASLQKMTELNKVVYKALL